MKKLAISLMRKYCSLKQLLKKEMIQLALVQQLTFELLGDERRADDSSLSQLALGGEAGEEEKVVREEVGEGGNGGAPGKPRVQLNPTLAIPQLVVRLRQASPPANQTDINSLTDAVRNWEFVLAMLILEKTADRKQDHLVCRNSLIILI